MVELIPYRPPPILILGLPDELGDLIFLFLLGDLLQVLIIPKMLELIIPAIGNTANLNTGQLILLIIGFVIALLTGGRFFLLAHSLQLVRGGARHPSPI